MSGGKRLYSDSLSSTSSTLGASSLLTRDEWDPYAAHVPSSSTPLAPLLPPLPHHVVWSLLPRGTCRIPTPLSSRSRPVSSSSNGVSSADEEESVVEVLVRMDVCVDDDRTVETSGDLAWIFSCMTLDVMVTNGERVWRAHDIRLDQFFKTPNFSAEEFFEDLCLAMRIRRETILYYVESLCSLCKNEDEKEQVRRLLPSSLRESLSTKTYSWTFSLTPSEAIEETSISGRLCEVPEMTVFVQPSRDKNSFFFLLKLSLEEVTEAPFFVFMNPLTENMRVLENQVATLSRDAENVQEYREIAERAVESSLLREQHVLRTCVGVINAKKRGNSDNQSVPPLPNSDDRQEPASSHSVLRARDAFSDVDSGESDGSPPIKRKKQTSSNRQSRHTDSLRARTHRRENSTLTESSSTPSSLEVNIDDGSRDLLGD